MLSVHTQEEWILLMRCMSPSIKLQISWYGDQLRGVDSYVISYHKSLLTILGISLSKLAYNRFGGQFLPLGTTVGHVNHSLPNQTCCLPQITYAGWLESTLDGLRQRTMPMVVMVGTNYRILNILNHLARRVGSANHTRPPLILISMYLFIIQTFKRKRYEPFGGPSMWMRYQLHQRLRYCNHCPMQWEVWNWKLEPGLPFLQASTASFWSYVVFLETKHTSVCTWRTVHESQEDSLINCISFLYFNGSEGLNKCFKYTILLYWL